MDGERAKRDLKVFVQRLQRAYGGVSSTFSAFWFMEFQKSGRIHFHIFCTGTYGKQFISRSWYEIVGSDDQYHLKCGTRIEGIRAGKAGMQRYAAKYAAKSEQKIVPDSISWVGRFWGVFGLRMTCTADTIIEGSEDQNRHNLRLLEFLKGQLQDSVTSGATVKLKGMFGSRVYVLKDKKLLARARLLVLNSFSYQRERFERDWMYEYADDL